MDIFSIFQQINSQYSCLVRIILVTNKLYCSWSVFFNAVLLHLCCFLQPLCHSCERMAMIVFIKMYKVGRSRVHSSQGKSQHLLRVHHLEHPLRDIAY